MWARPRPISYDGALGRQIVELHVWAVGQGLRGTDAAVLFDALCERLVAAGVPLWRAFAGMRTLHPQWGGYGYTWWRDLNAVQPEQFERGREYEQVLLASPFSHLISQVEGGPGEGSPWRHLRRRLAGPEARLDFPILEVIAASGATDYFAEIVRFGAGGDPSRGTGVGYSFATDRTEGFPRMTWCCCRPSCLSPRSR
jgi:adenylate cyclase